MGELGCRIGSVLSKHLARKQLTNLIMPMHVEVEVEADGRWIAEVRSIPGALAYGITKAEAVVKVEALVLRILADKVEHGEKAPELSDVFIVAV